MGIPGVLKRLFGQFVSGEMVSFSVRGCGGAVGVGRKVMKFRSSIVRALRHNILLANWMRLGGSLPRSVHIAPSNGFRGLRSEAVLVPSHADACAFLQRFAPMVRGLRCVLGRLIRPACASSVPRSSSGSRDGYANRK